MSAIVKDILKEELARSVSLRRKIFGKLREYGAGSLLKRLLKGRVYYYLSYRDKASGQVRQKYLGVLSPSEVADYERKMKLKQDLRRQLQEINGNIRYLERVLKK